MLSKNNMVLACLAGVSAAAVTILSVGGYLLHKKVMKNRLQELARQQAANLDFMNRHNLPYDGFDEYEDEDGEDDYYDGLFEDFDKDGYENLINELNRED